MGLVDRVLAGDIRAVARLATHIENETDLGNEALIKLYAHTGRSHIVGITGAPGAGKSTLTGALIQQIRQTEKTVGVIAVDPSSPISGGAALGDRIRMLDTWNDPGVYIRSMASRGRYGGLAPTTANLIHLLDAAGFDVVLVETVGVGQEEIDITFRAHTTIVLQVPGFGDDVQALKAGLLEVADIFVVNKADLAGANAVVRSLRALIGPVPKNNHTHWTPPIIKTIGTSGEGLAQLAASIEKHHSFLQASGQWETRAYEMARRELEALVWQQLKKQLVDEITTDAHVGQLITKIAEREISPLQGANTFLATHLRV